MTWMWEALQNAVLITGLVMIMMFLIEFINTSTSGAYLGRLQDKPFLQVIVAAALGFIPGCAGGFIVVSLYAHNLLSFGALLAMLIATLGDDGFFLLAMLPGKGLLISMGLFVLAVVCGFFADKLRLRLPRPYSPAHFQVHQGHDRPWRSFGKGQGRLSPYRAILLLGISLFTACIFTGFLSHSHAHSPEAAHTHGTELCCEDPTHVHTHASAHADVGNHVCEGHEAHDTHDTHEAHAHGGHGTEMLLKYLFGLVALITLVFTFMASEHFIKEHIWDHIVKHHFLKIFLWTLGALLLIGLAMEHIHLDRFFAQNYALTLLIALAIGLIPESGPNMVFISLFATGNLPLSILLANSIVQDGHAALPLLAETKKGFVVTKALKILLALATALPLQLLIGL